MVPREVLTSACSRVKRCKVERGDGLIIEAAHGLDDGGALVALVLAATTAAALHAHGWCGGGGKRITGRAAETNVSLGYTTRPTPATALACFGSVGTSRPSGRHLR